MAQTLKQQLISGFTGAALAAGATLTPALAQDANQQTAAVSNEDAAPKGKPVTLRVGPGFSLAAADGIARVVDDHCPVTVTSEGGFPKRLTVEVEGHRKFRTKSVGSAGAAALEGCRDPT